MTSENWQEKVDENLIRLWDNRDELSIGDQKAIYDELVKRGCLNPAEELAKKLEAELKLKPLDSESKNESENKRTDQNNKEAIPELRWKKIPDNKLLEGYRALHQQDIISQEIICAEIKRRGLEVKAAHLTEIKIYKVDLVQLGNIPFFSILEFVWKWTWACIVVSVPFILLVAFLMR